MSRCTFCHQPININKEKISRKNIYKNGKPIKTETKTFSWCIRCEIDKKGDVWFF